VIFAAIADWADAREFPVTFMCERLHVSRSGYYRWRRRVACDHQLHDEYLSTLLIHLHAHLGGNPGVRRLHAELVASGIRTSRKRVWRLMRTAGLQGRHPKAWRTTTNPGEPSTAPDLIARDFTASQANRKWCGDITYIKTWDGWAYLATVIDLHSRKVVGYSVANHMRTSLIEDALDMAIRHRSPGPGVIFHSDRGSQYTSARFAEFCTRNNVVRSLGSTGICYDNAVSESFFATYKKELIHTRPWPTLNDLRRRTFSWIEEYYNRTRRHSTLGYLTPEEYEQGHRTIAELAA